MNYSVFSDVLQAIGNGHYKTANVTKGRNKVGECFWLTGPLNESGKATILKYYPHAEFLVSVAQYAPELKKVAVLIPTKAEIKRRSEKA